MGKDMQQGSGIRAMSFKMMAENGTLYSYCQKEAAKVDFLTDDERKIYTLALMDAALWAICH